MTHTPPVPNAASAVQIDIISDIMCPWCIVGFKQLEMALAQTGMGARVRWHPFELNPDMGGDGENLSEHIQRKYGASEEDSRKTRAHLHDIGAALGIPFAFSPDSRIVNSFAAHCLLDFAAAKGLQHPLKLALFSAHFSQERDVSDQNTLIEVAESVGLDPQEASQALNDPKHAQAVRAQENVWTQNGISGVPTMIFAEKYILTGAQGPKTYADMLQRVAADAA